MEGPRLLAGGGDLLIRSPAKPSRARQPDHRQTRPDQTGPVSARSSQRPASIFSSYDIQGFVHLRLAQAALCQAALQGDEPMPTDMVMDMRRETSWRLWPHLLVCQMPHMHTQPHMHHAFSSLCLQSVTL